MKNKLIGGIFGLVGVGLLCLTVFLWNRTSAFIARAITVQGEVIELVARTSTSSGSSGSSTTYAPKFRFEAQDGRTYEVTSSTSSKPASFEVGETVTVLYEPDDPNDAAIQSFGQLWLGVLICGILGTVFTVVGVLAVVFGGRRSHRALEGRSGRSAWDEVSRDDDDRDDRRDDHARDGGARSGWDDVAKG